MLISFIICACVIILDQVSKFLLYGESFKVLGDFLWVESTLNTGASFGMLKGGGILFICITIPLVVLMGYFICSKRWGLSKFFKISLAILLGGTIGNLIDRIFFAGVRDFIYLKFINFPIFNVADIAITIGTGLLILAILLHYINLSKKEKLQKQSNTEEQNNNTSKEKEEQNKENKSEDIKSDSEEKGKRNIREK